MNDSTEDWKPDSQVIDDMLRRFEASGIGLDQKTFKLGDEFYTPNQIIQEIENRTDLGKKFYGTHLKLMERLAEGEKKKTTIIMQAVRAYLRIPDTNNKIYKD